MARARRLELVVLVLVLHLGPQLRQPAVPPVHRVRHPRARQQRAQQEQAGQAYQRQQEQQVQPEHQLVLRPHLPRGRDARRAVGARPRLAVAR